MKSLVTILSLLLIGIAASAWAQGGSVEKGKSLVQSKNCTLCHKEGGLSKPIEIIAGKNTDAFIKEVITNPKKAFGPDVRMPGYKLTDEQLQDIIAYLRSIAKH